MISAAEALEMARRPPEGATYQHAINQLIDDFRRAGLEERRAMTATPISGDGPLEALVAAVIEALSVEVGMPPPAWVGAVASKHPFFVFDAKSFALRARLMIESPPAFRMRRLFVPEDYLSRR